MYVLFGSDNQGDDSYEIAPVLKIKFSRQRRNVFSISVCERDKAVVSTLTPVTFRFLLNVIVWSDDLQVFTPQNPSFIQRNLVVLEGCV